MPPQGLLAIAGYLPDGWSVRLIDENVGPARATDFAWADAVLISGMHIQRALILDVNRRAHAAGKVTVLGGPSVSATPELYPEIDYLHIGEIGDATDRLFARLDADSEPPPAQERFETVTRLPLSEFPLPAYHLIRMDRYFLGNVQYSSGCPYRCEFCDIPALYGRTPRLKTPDQVIGEIEAILSRGNPGVIYFVDDNFIGNKKAARDLLEPLIAWQKRRGYPVQFACEATLNIAKQPELLAMMREAFFRTVFCGIETPEIGALHAMAKEHNTTIPILEAVATVNAHGMEVVSGIILGLDTDTPDTAARVLEFIRQSNIPMLTINLLQALPRTPLWDRLAREGRLVEDPERESNVDFRLPYEQVVAMWRTCMAEAYRPEDLYRRFLHNIEHVYPKRLHPPVSPERASRANIEKAVRSVIGLALQVGARSDYRALFWRTAWSLLRRGRIEDLIHVGLVAHHLISFARDAVAGRQNASFYSSRDRRGAADAEPLRASTG